MTDRVLMEIGNSFSMDHQNYKLWHYSEKGMRPTNEDAELIEILQIKDTEYLLLGVFDGHGGSSCSSYLAKRLSDVLQDNPGKNLDEIIHSTNKSLNEEFLEKKDLMFEGSCALYALISKSGDTWDLKVVNIGDSRAILGGNETIQLNREHKPNDPTEEAYIISQGSYVKGRRVAGQLAVSRAFGDKYLTDRGLRCEAEITDFIITQEQNLLILACDGLWDVLSNDEVMQYIKEHLDMENPAQLLTQLAIDEGSWDNISVIACQFEF
ncbi:MAG: protein serine/threonine phosphatase 2C family protein [Candidatus Heimdallarchaeota archaeon]|nr:protein serine/threonine phosphatase 2C family protein [Candidatus Heimdallarchaeota archaeon]